MLLLLLSAVAVCNDEMKLDRIQWIRKRFWSDIFHFNMLIIHNNENLRIGSAEKTNQSGITAMNDF